MYAETSLGHVEIKMYNFKPLLKYLRLFDKVFLMEFNLKTRFEVASLYMNNKVSL
jgi:hypothetical protein